MCISVSVHCQVARVVFLLPKMDPTIPQPIDTPVVSSVAGGVAMSSGKKPMKVMVAIDDSDTSYYALKWTVDHLFDASGIGETRRVPGEGGKGAIIILHVQQPVRQTEAQTVTKALEENSARIIARAMEVCRGTSVTVEAMIVVGEPKETICDVAEKIHPDLAVVGSRGLGKIKRAFLGSVSDYCAQHLDCPVLIAKPAK